MRTTLEPLFIDCGGIDLLVSPTQVDFERFWKWFPKNCSHLTSHIVSWEYLRKFSAKSNSEFRQRFVKLIDSKKIDFTFFGPDERKVAIRIYHLVKEQLEAKDKTTAKSVLQAMHCDIMIASEALLSRRTVLTQDVGDWSRITTAIQRGKLGTLKLIDRKDIQNG